MLPISASEASNWPSLCFHFMLKRSAMTVYGQSSFDMFANPVVSDNQDTVLYDVLATFSDGSTTHKYTLIDGIGYSSTGDSEVNCLDSEAGKLPAVNSIVAALNDAVAVSSDSIDCPSGKLFKITVHGIDLALCASGSSGFTLSNSDMDVTVEFMTNHIAIQVPSADMSERCEKVASSTAMTSFGKSILTGQ
ncbi:hypothetical protein PHYSODRAFT_513567, partial [Phytophthora sojae]